MLPLETRRLGRTGMTPKALGLGCAFFGNKNTVTDQTAIEGIRHAIDLGIDFLDTSAGYGESERRVGLALEGGYRDKVYLQTKTGTHPERRGDYSAEATRWSVENSLRVLKTDHFDSALIHDPRDIEDAIQPGAALDELLKMKSEGLVHNIGLGLRSHDFHKRGIATGHIDLILTYLEYTLLSQTAAETLLPFAKQHDVGILLASVQGMGTLAGPKPDLETAERRNPGKGQLALDMWNWCHKRGVNIRQMALQFCLAADIDGIVLAGPNSKQQVDEVYASATASVDRDLWRDFEDAFGVGI